MITILEQKIEQGIGHQCELLLLLTICAKLGLEEEASRTLSMFGIKHIK